MNPWTTVLYKDYERHMKNASVYQFQTLNKILKLHLQKFKPESVLVLGCAGGNGLEHIDDDITKKVIGIDINKTFLELCKKVCKNKKFTLDLICCDIEVDELLIENVNFIHCALFLEYVVIQKVLIKIKSILKSNGKLNIVLQRNNNKSFISETGIESLKVLETISKEIDEKYLQDKLKALDFKIESKKIYNLPNGKDFISYICYID